MRSCCVAVVVLAAVVAVASAREVRPCGDWVLYKQCGESWSNYWLGTSRTETICDAGCAMSCVSMSLATYHERLGRTVPDPGTVNAWLTSHHGYVDTDLIVWNAVAPLGKLHMESDVPHLTTTDIRKAVDRCKPVIANVRDGTHWVLITGYDTADSDLFYVNDPGFEEKSYAYSGMSNFVTYSNHSTAAAAEAFASYQKQRASLKAAKQVAVAPASPLDGVYGVDVSQPTSSSDFTCMKDKHAVSFVVIRSFTELGSPDPAVVDTARDARAAGVDVSVYHFPDTSQSASSQIRSDIDNLRNNGVDFDYLWLDVERSDWGSNTTWNTLFIRELAEEAQAMGVRVGIYSSESQWGPITGNTEDLHDYPLWWPTYNYQPNFDGFRAFGGWNAPFMHQYKGNIDLCGAGVDVNWRA